VVQNNTTDDRGQSTAHAVVSASDLAVRAGVAQRKRGPRPLSPNGVKQELAREQKRRAQRRKTGTRGRTVRQKREAEVRRRRRQRVCQGKRLGGQEAGRLVRRRWKCVRYYQHWRQRLPEQEAARRTAGKYGWSVATVRLYVRRYRQGGLAALLPRPRGPGQATRHVSPQVEQLIVALRLLYGWNERRMAAELAQRGLAQISHTTVGRIYHRSHLPLRTYHGKARSEGLSYSRYEKQAANVQWHMDFAQLTLPTGEELVLAVVVDDYSRFCLACEVIADLRSETAAALIERLCARYAVQPQEIVTDNGSAFRSLYTERPTAFGVALAARHITHRSTSLYYPEGNGKAEAFIKSLKHEAFCSTAATLAAVTTLDELHHALLQFQDYYNFYRLHSSLAYQPPACRYWGIVVPHDHGLAGLPNLPLDLAQAYPPSPYFQPGDTSPAARRQALLPLSLGC